MTSSSFDHYLSAAPLPPPSAPPPVPPSALHHQETSAQGIVAPPQTRQQQEFYSDDHFGIIDSLNYDDVDDGLIEREMDHRRRETLVQQLLASEQAYFQSLKIIQQIFIEPLKKDAKQSSFNFLGMKKMICTERETRWLFGNLEEIITIHKDILVYNGYLANYGVAITTYERLTRYQPFKKFIDSTHKDPALKGATLLSLLQTPAGCISRYAQLMSHLADATSPMHPDHVALKFCKQKMLSIAEEMRPRQDADNVDQVLMIHQALVGAPFGVKAQRRLVLQSPISRIQSGSKSGTPEERIYILFSDMLVFVRPKQEGDKMILQFRGMASLERATIKALEGTTSIEITSPMQGVDTLNTTFVGSASVHVMQTETKDEQERWLKHLQLVVDELDRAAKEALNKANRRRVAQSRKDTRSLSSSEKS
ncbi:Dbl homology domain-containing protein [Dichotomocladium elegans]|nr:Dbl homology domain-containing protein [Dichotomocladium elegans]